LVRIVGLVLIAAPVATVLWPRDVDEATAFVAAVRDAIMKLNAGDPSWRVTEATLEIGIQSKTETKQQAGSSVSVAVGAEQQRSHKLTLTLMPAIVAPESVALRDRLAADSARVHAAKPAAAPSRGPAVKP
jgi:hypothetical protein